jgi:hypothetical protein
MCWSRLSSLFRPPWTPERPRYPIRLKVRLMDCPGRGEEGSDVPRILAEASMRTVVLGARALRRAPCTPQRGHKGPAQRSAPLLYT